MDTQMFCFQCEQTAGSKGCMGKAGVCGKTSDVAGLQDQLTGALVGLARAADGAAQPIENVCKLMIKGLFTTITNVNFNEVTIQALIPTVLPAAHAARTMITTWQRSGTPTRIFAV